ncbi:hypothetical protein PRIPAC_76812, partial [Pristionchus pacificus]|uniref:Uncharacterized protein n=1 Tax=Pristionchus pacificus TaxID=54126 RepID=A0A2A6CP17_PRIPA|eukprot:PDM79942.1 hypothetical protein PRIPAC_32521 [Pristionchus pacificus]
MNSAITHRISDMADFTGRIVNSPTTHFFEQTIWTVQTALLPIIVFERIYAVWACQTYDETSDNFPKTCSIILIALVSISTLGAALEYAGYYDGRILMYICQVISIATVPIFFYYLHYTSKNAKRVMEARFLLMANNLSRRYQLVEAERSMVMLK